MIVLEIQDLHKQFAGSPDYAVKNFNVKVAQGEIYGLLGESGCGKTTILRMISGFEEPNKGYIRIYDKVVYDEQVFIQPEQRGVGIVFQDYALFPNKTVAENIEFGLFMFSRQLRKQKTTEMIRITGLDGLGKRYPHELSGGQKQRVALARALAPEPRLILMDEPFSNLDTLRKNQMREEVRTIIKNTGATGIFVTHDTKDVLAIADRVSVIRQGLTLQADTPGNMYNTPRNAYVAQFFGKTNVLAARVCEGGFNTPVGFIASDTPLPPGTTEVMLSIRPESLELADDEMNCVCGRVKSENFTGEFKELICTIKDINGKDIQLLVYAPPNQHCHEDTCYIRPKDNTPPGILDG